MGVQWGPTSIYIRKISMHHGMVIGRIRPTSAKKGEIVHTHLGIAPYECELRFAHMVCESWG